MVERFENLNIILGDWAKGKIHKSLVDALNRYEKEIRSYHGRPEISKLAQCE